MNDSPTQPSIFTRRLLTDTHGSELLYSFLVTGTLVTIPGLRPTVMPPAMFAPIPGTMPSGSTPGKSRPK